MPFLTTNRHVINKQIFKQYKKCVILFVVGKCWRLIEGSSLLLHQITLLVNNQPDAQFFSIYVYFDTLDVSSAGPNDRAV